MASSWYNLPRDEEPTRTHWHQRPIARRRPNLPQRRCERHDPPTAAPPTSRRSRSATYRVRAGCPLEASGTLAVRRSRRWNTQRPIGRILWEQLALPVLAQTRHLDLLHGAVNVGPLFAPCPTVITIHDLSFVRYPQAFPAFQRVYLQTQVRRSVRAARRVIAVSEATKRDVTALFGVPDERIDVVYNGVDASFSPAPAGEIEAFRRRKGLPERYVLHVGTLEPRKNLVRLVQAFTKARPQGQTGVKLVLAGGKGWGYDDIFAEVSRLGMEQDVIFPGYVPDDELAWWYRGAEIFCYPSLLEGFGLPVVEAMACGVPVITSNLSSLPEVAGNAALLIDPTEVDALAEALRPCWRTRCWPMS